MRNFLTKFFLLLFVLVAFVGPVAAVFSMEKLRRTEQVISQQEGLIGAQKEVALARYQYYMGLSDQKANLKQAMQESRDQYDQLMKDQPALVKANQTAVTQTVIKPVKVQKVVTQQVPVTSSTPKSSTKTKTS